MFHELVANPGERSPDEMVATYTEALAAIIEEFGSGRVAEETGLDDETVEAASTGDLDEVTLEEGAAVLALSGEYPPAEDGVALARDALLMGMTNAVMDVEALSSEIGGELEPRELQQKVEGRFPISLAEYALLHHHVQRDAH